MCKKRDDHSLAASFIGFCCIPQLNAMCIINSTKKDANERTIHSHMSDALIKLFTQIIFNLNMKFLHFHPYHQFVPLLPPHNATDRWSELLTLTKEHVPHSQYRRPWKSSTKYAHKPFNHIKHRLNTMFFLNIYFVLEQFMLRGTLFGCKKRIEHFRTNQMSITQTRLVFQHLE